MAREKTLDRFGPKHKIRPEHLAGMIGLPSIGDIIYVDAGDGNDSTNDGGTRDNALATVEAALSAATADQDDIILVTGSNSTGRTSETSSVTWSKRRTHLIGNGPSREINPRQGMSFAASTSPCFTVSTRNCIFRNISIATFEDNNILVDITDDYNTWEFVHFQGIGNATAGDDTAARSLRITAAEENEFYGCTIGLDTVARSAANASLELTGSSARNRFTKCTFPVYADNAGVLWLKADTGNCYERFLIFDGCRFLNPTTGSSTTLTTGFDLSATGNGTVHLYDCAWEGATDLSNDYTNLYSNIPVFDTGNAGLESQVAT